MNSLQKLFRLLIFICCLSLIGVSNLQAQSASGNQNAFPNWGGGGYGNMGSYHPMFNPAMWMNPMTWMNPGNYMSLMNPGVWMNPGNYMQMMNPMAYMNMMGPMMGMMGPMMNPAGMMGGGYGGYGTNNPMGQMMDPKQYEQWFNQWTEMMQNMAPPQANQ